MQPLAAAILACPDDMAIRLAHALFDYNERLALKMMLDAALQEAAR